MNEVNYWQLLTGLGLFLYGMLLLEAGLKGLATRRIKSFLRNNTTNPFAGVLTGTVATAVLQSSSVTGLLVLAFVGAGILDLRHSLGIIFGSNLGTTFTGWIVATIGFKLDLDSFALPLLAIGSLALVFLKTHTRPWYFASLVFGLGFLLTGLGFMKESVASLSGLLDVQALANYPLPVFLLAGAAFTAVIQSSSATMMIVLAALHGNIIELPAAAALVIGADLGTTSTLLIGGMKGSKEKKQVAFSHFLFNLVSDILAFILLFPLLAFLQIIVGITDPMYLLVAFHSSFNIIGIIIFLPFVGRFAKILERLFHEPDHIACIYVPRVPPAVDDAAIEAVRQENKRLLYKALIFSARNFKIEEHRIIKESVFSELQLESSPRPDYEEAYTEIKEIEGELISYIREAINLTNNPDAIEELDELNHLVRKIVYGVKTIKDVRHNLVEFRMETDEQVNDLYRDLTNQFKTYARQFIELSDSSNDEIIVEKSQEMGSNLRESYESTNRNILSPDITGRVSDLTLSSLLNANKAFLLSMEAFLECAGKTAAA